LLGPLIPAGSPEHDRARRLTNAASGALARVAVEEARITAAGEEMFAAVGETLIWLVALEDVVAVGGQYWTKLGADVHGAAMPGIRYARNAVVHGDTVTRTVDSSGGAVLGAAVLGSFTLGAGPSTRWTDRASIGFTGKPSQYLAQQERSYDAELAGKDVSVPLAFALAFLRDAAGT